MATISVSLPADGSTADVADYNTPINTIVNEINGNIDNANIKSGAAIAGSKLATSSVPAGKIDFGGSGVGVWWEEIARTTLGVAGDTITVSSIPARTYLKIIYYGSATGGTLDTNFKFNNDSGANYAYHQSAAMAAGSSSTGNTSVAQESGATDSGGSSFTIMDVINVLAKEKLFFQRNVSTDAAGGATIPAVIESMGKWANTAAQISRVDFTNVGTGDFAIGSEVIVLGHN